MILSYYGKRAGHLDSHPDYHHIIDHAKGQMGLTSILLFLTHCRNDSNKQVVVPSVNQWPRGRVGIISLVV